MVKPIDYTIDVRNPFVSAIQGLVAAQKLRQQMIENRIKKEQQERKKSFIADMGEYAGKDVITSEDTKRLYTKYPEFAQNIERGISGFNESQRKEYANQLMPFYTAVRTGNTEYAKQYIGELQQAYENSGDKVQAQRIGDLGRSLDQGPQQAVLAGRLILGPLMGDEFYKMESSMVKPVQRQKTGMITVRDDKTKQIKMVVGSYDPMTEKLSVVEGTLPQNYSIVSDIGETPSERQLRMVGTAGQTKAVQKAIEAGAKYSEKSDLARQQVLKLDNAINVIEEGLAANANLGLGWIRSKLPKFNPYAIRMQQAARDLGLGVIQQVTFGALSEKELQLAMATAMPPELKPIDALKWLKGKRTAQLKLQTELDRAAAFIGSQNPDGTFNTIADWKKLQLQQRKKQQTRETPTQELIEGF